MDRPDRRQRLDTYSARDFAAAMTRICLCACGKCPVLHLELKKTAERDGLTGLYNRGFFEPALQMSIQGKAQTPSLEPAPQAKGR